MKNKNSKKNKVINSKASNNQRVQDFKNNFIKDKIKKIKKIESFIDNVKKIK